MTVPYQTRPTSELAHLAWCLLTSVRLAQKEGKAQSSLEQHVFVMQWLLAQGKKYGFGANLLKKVENIYRSSAEELATQSDLFRFTYFVETLKTMGWLDFIVSRKEWAQHWKGSNTASAIYTPKEDLQPSFDENGNLIKTLAVRFTGDISSIFPLLEQCHLRAQQQPEHEGFSVFHLNMTD